MDSVMEMESSPPKLASKAASSEIGTGLDEHGTWQLGQCTTTQQQQQQQPKPKTKQKHAHIEHTQKPGVVVHTCNLANQGWRQENQEFEASIVFKASLSYTTPPVWFKKWGRGPLLSRYTDPSCPRLSSLSGSHRD